VNYALTSSNVSTAKANTWQTTTSAPSGNIDSIVNGTQRKLKKPEKPEANSTCLAVGGNKV